ncbi:MAG TPA: IS30 family transposase [bacterium]|nr:IS30 family transposase [bacterium]
MSKKFRHLSIEERDLIAVMRGQGKSFREIAGKLGRCPSTISREFKRNAPPIYTGYYLAHKAHERAVKRNRESHRRPRLKSPELRRYVLSKLQLGWSPELIAGRLALQKPSLRISHEAIYQWIYAEAENLVRFLARGKKRRRRRYPGKKQKSLHIPGRNGIERRPKHVEKRLKAGHWESDTAVSWQGQAALLVTVERKTRFTRLHKLNRKTAAWVRSTLNRSLSRLPGKLLKSLTYDNGRENVEHERVNAVLGTRSYFCTPFHSWEKGTVENTVGLVRRFLPKRTDFAKVSKNKIKSIERWLNHRPRKCLNFKTPAEAFALECCNC